MKKEFQLMPTHREKARTTLSIPKDLREYLDGLAEKADRDRSWVMSALVRTHKESKGE
jgi:predicted transcriptional regulator